MSNERWLADSNTIGVYEDFTISQVEPSDDYERIMYDRHDRYLEELGRICRVAPRYDDSFYVPLGHAKKVKIIVKRVEEAEG